MITFVDRFAILPARCRRSSMKFTVLGSGSTGNAGLISSETTNVLVDAGMSAREILRRLGEMGVAHDGLDGDSFGPLSNPNPFKGDTVIQAALGERSPSSLCCPSSSFVCLFFLPKTKI